jgi:hypothetical protein
LEFECVRRGVCFRRTRSTIGAVFQFAILFSALTTSTLGDRAGCSESKGRVDAMFTELTEELLDLTANPQRYRYAYLAQTRRPILCCSSCCTVVVE